MRKNLYEWPLLAGCTKWFGAGMMLLLSGLLSYSYFSGMNSDIPLFPLLALSLTEGGIILWVVIFFTENHHPIKSLISGLMVVLCIGTTSLVTATSMIEYVFHLHNVISLYATGVTNVVLCAMLMAHMLSMIATPLIDKIEHVNKSIDGHTVSIKQSVDSVPLIRNIDGERKRGRPLEIRHLPQVDEQGDVQPTNSTL